MAGEKVGDAYVEVHPEDPGFRRELKRIVDAATAQTRAAVKMTVDSRGFRRSLQTMAKTQSSGVHTDVAVKVDARGMRGEVTRATKAAGAGQEIKVEAKVDVAKLHAIRNILGRLQLPSGLAAKLAAVAAVLVSVAAGAVQVTGALGPMTGLLATVPGLAAAAGQGIGTLLLGFSGIGETFKAITQYEDSLVTSSGTAARAAESSARRRQAAAEQVEDAARSLARAQRDADRAAEDGARQVADAREALADAQADAADVEVASARRVADARENLADAQAAAARVAVDAARRVGDAERALSDAREQAARRAVDAARRVTDAQKRLTDAVEDEREAQLAVAEAREDALRSLEDLHFEVRRGAISEQEAVWALADAEQKLADIRDGWVETSARGRKEAELTYEEAKLQLEEVRARNARNAEELEEAHRKGIDGSDQVVAAQKRQADAAEQVQEAVAALAEAQADAGQVARDNARMVADAQRDVADAIAEGQRAQADAADRVGDAQRGVEDALRDSARAQADAQEAVADAQRNLARAQRDLAEGFDAAGGAGESAMLKVRDRLADLSPAARRFVAIIQSLRGEFNLLRHTAQEGLFPGVNAAVLLLADSLFPLVHDAVARTSRVLGDLAYTAAQAFTTPAFKGDLATILDSNVRLLGVAGRSGINFALALVGITAEAAPLTEWLAGLVERLSAYVLEQVNAARESGRMAAFFERTKEVASQLGRIVWDLGAALFHVFSAGSESGQGLLDKLEEAAEKFREWAASTEGQERIKRFFDDLNDAVAAFVSGIGSAKAVMDPFIPSLRTLADNLDVVVASFLAVKAVSAGLSFMQMAGSLAAIGPHALVVVGAIGLLTGAFIYAYQHSDTFRTAVNTAFQKVKDFVAQITPQIRGIITSFVDLALLVWREYGDEIMRIVNIAWSFVQRIVRAALSVIQGLVKVFTGIFTGDWSLVWEGAGDIAWGALEAIKAVVRAAWDTILVVLRIFGTTLSNAWNRIWQWAEDRLHGAVEWMGRAWRSALDGLGRMAESARDWIGRIFDGIKGTFARPINAVIEYAINPFIRGARSIAKTLGWDLGIGEMAKVQVHHTGGVVGESTGASRRMDDVRAGERLILARDGEEVLTAADPRHRRNLRPVEHDVYQAVPGDEVGGAFDWIGSQVSHLVDGARRLIADTVRPAVSAAIGGIAGLVEQRGGVAGRLAGGLARRVGHGVLDWLAGVERRTSEVMPPAGTVGAGDAGGTGHPYQRLIQYLVRTGTPHRVTSTVRPGSITSSGRLSLHALKRAADFAGIVPTIGGYRDPGLRRIFNAFLPIAKNLAELILAGAPFNIKNGRQVPPYAVKDHLDHVHAALAGGGVFARPWTGLVSMAETARSRPEVVSPVRMMADTFREVLADRDRRIVSYGSLTGGDGGAAEEMVEAFRRAVHDAPTAAGVSVQQEFHVNGWYRGDVQREVERANRQAAIDWTLGANR